MCNCVCLFVVCCFFSKSIFSINSFRNATRVANSLDLDQTDDLIFCLLCNCLCFFVVCFCMLFCRLLIFFKIYFFDKFFQEYHQSGEQFGSRSSPTEPDVLSGLIWVQSVCKGYQLTKLVGKG